MEILKNYQKPKNSYFENKIKWSFQTSISCQFRVSPSDTVSYKSLSVLPKRDLAYVLRRPLTWLEYFAVLANLIHNIYIYRSIHVLLKIVVCKQSVVSGVYLRLGEYKFKTSSNQLEIEF